MAEIKLGYLPGSFRQGQDGLRYPPSHHNGEKGAEQHDGEPGDTGQEKSFELSRNIIIENPIPDSERPVCISIQMPVDKDILLAALIEMQAVEFVLLAQNIEFADVTGPDIFQHRIVNILQFWHNIFCAEGCGFFRFPLLCQYPVKPIKNKPLPVGKDGGRRHAGIDRRDGNGGDDCTEKRSVPDDGLTKIEHGVVERRHIDKRPPASFRFLGKLSDCRNGDRIVAFIHGDDAVGFPTGGRYLEIRRHIGE